jgi:hypothetical protein
MRMNMKKQAIMIDNYYSGGRVRTVEFIVDSLEIVIHFRTNDNSITNYNVYNKELPISIYDNKIVLQLMINLFNYMDEYEGYFNSNVDRSKPETYITFSFTI